LAKLAEIDKQSDEKWSQEREKLEALFEEEKGSLKSA